jgi:hypothetical protein
MKAIIFWALTGLVLFSGNTQSAMFHVLEENPFIEIDFLVNRRRPPALDLRKFWRDRISSRKHDSPATALQSTIGITRVTFQKTVGLVAREGNTGVKRGTGTI